MGMIWLQEKFVKVFLLKSLYGLDNNMDKEETVY
jgi:hypothetical protein